MPQFYVSKSTPGTPVVEADDAAAAVQAYVSESGLADGDWIAVPADAFVTVRATRQVTVQAEVVDPAA